VLHFQNLNEVATQPRRVAFAVREHGRGDSAAIVFFGLNCRTEGLIADFLPTPAGLGCTLAVEHPFGSGEQAENYRVLFIGETGFDDKSTELDLAPGIEPAIGINDSLHPSSIPQ
jgi:hypothetical protein